MNLTAIFPSPPKTITISAFIAESFLAFFPMEKLLSNSYFTLCFFRIPADFSTAAFARAENILPVIATFEIFFIKTTFFSQFLPSCWKEHAEYPEMPRNSSYLSILKFEHPGAYPKNLYRPLSWLPEALNQFFFRQES